MGKVLKLIQFGRTFQSRNICWRKHRPSLRHDKRPVPKGMYLSIHQYIHVCVMFARFWVCMRDHVYSYEHAWVRVCVSTLPINQSTNQSINQPVDEPINQSINQLINQLIINQSINLAINQSVDEPINQLIN